MFRKWISLSVLVLCLSCTLSAADGFSSHRLRQMALVLTDIPFRQLGVGTHTEYQYFGHSLNIRVNNTGDVEHIGYLLFNNDIHRQSSAIYDFIERYTLELEMMDAIDRNIRMGIDKFMFEVGTLNDIHQLEKADKMEILMVENKGYRVAWYHGNVCLVSLLFNMDYQMIVGSNVIELEQRYLFTVGRRDTLNNYKVPVTETDSGEVYFVVDNGNFLTDAIRATQYFERDTMGEWEPVLNATHPRWSASNLMLSPISLGDYTLQCRLDMYGYQDSSFSLPISRWISETMQEGCQLYFGVKSFSSKVIHGTVFCPNKTAGYCHMMSVDIPIDDFNDKKGIIKGRLYVYIPMHNIVDDYFDLNYLPINKE